MRFVAPLVFGALILELGGTVAATTYLVPSPQCPTIQAGIDSAAAGDTVLVASGTYGGVGNRNLDFSGKAIVLMSETGPRATIIDCEGLGRGFFFHGGEDSGSVVRGFTIQNGVAADGGGIRCHGASPTIEGNIIRGNVASNRGGAIFCRSASSPVVRGNVIVGNTAADGGGIYCRQGTSPIIEANTITGNVATDCGGGIYSINSSPTVVNSILWADTAGTGPEIYLASGSIQVEYSDVQGGWTGVGNIDADPRLVEGPLGDSYLSHIAAGQPQQSPCVDAGDPSAAVPEGTTRTDGVPDLLPIDMGYHHELNRPPNLADQADTTVAEYLLLTLTLAATDPDGDSISYSSPDLPAGATLDSVTGIFQWTPTYDQAGSHTTTFTATDNGSPALADTEQIDITVTDVNRPPELADHADTTVAENQYVTFTLVATDPDGDSISYSSPDLPSGAILNSVTGVFEWTPTYDQAGPYTVTFIATDYSVPALTDTAQTDITVTDVTGVMEEGDGLNAPPAQYLAQNHPNPFASTTTITYSLLAPTRVALSIYDIRGALVRRLESGMASAGQHRVTWDGRDDRSHKMASGVYFCRLEAGDFREARRMTIVR